MNSITPEQHAQIREMAERVQVPVMTLLYSVVDHSTQVIRLRSKEANEPHVIFDRPVPALRLGDWSGIEEREKVKA